MNKRVLILSMFVGGALMFSSCAKQNNPPSKVKDLNVGNERIYGEIDGPPKQVANVYPDDPASVQKADALRQKLFGKN
jgi:hypothetical protein